MTESNLDAVPSSSSLRKIFSPIVAIVGPAAVMAAGIMGAGSTVSTLAAGCWFGYALLWAVFLALPAIVICQDTASRIGAVSGSKGMMRLIADEMHPVIMWLLVLPLLGIGIIANIGQLGAMAAAIGNVVNVIGRREIVPANPDVWTNVAIIAPLVCAVLAVNAFGGYKRIEKLLTFLLCVVLVSFLIVAIQAFFHWEEIETIFRGLWPELPADIPYATDKVRRSFISFGSIVGGGIAATAILSFPYFTREGGYNLDNIRAKFRRHVLLFAVVFGVYSLILMVAGGYALHPLEGSAGFEGAGQMGKALESALGPAGTIFFSIGLFICGFNTLTVVAQLASYFVLDCAGRNWRFEKGNRLFLVPFVLFMAVPAFFAAVWNFPNMLKVVIAMVCNCLVSPLAIVVIMILINKRSLAGPLKASLLRNVFLLYSLALVLFTAVLAVIRQFG